MRRPLPVPPALRRFARDEAGSMLVFGIFMLVLMLMIGGLAVDVMRFEQRRARMQATLDRAVLAAASLSQTRPPAEVVRDYMVKAGLGDELAEPVVNADSLNARSISATARSVVPTTFMRMLDIDSLTAPAAASAEEMVSNVEISLVLDISNSMIKDQAGNPRDRLKNLKLAAKDFVDIVMAGANTGRPGAPMISISIVPYTGQVNIGPDLWATYPNRTRSQRFSQCVDFDAADYSTTDLPNNRALVGSGNAEHFAKDAAPQRPTFYWCPQASGSGDPVVRTYWHEPEALKAAIDGLKGEGSTAIDIGMKWGVTLLDPSSRPSITALVDAGKVAEAFRGRPLDYAQSNTMKVIVLMTDGQHTNHEPRLANTIKADGVKSEVYLGGDATSEYRYPSLKSGSNYYWFRTNATRSTPDTYVGSGCTETNGVVSCKTVKDSGKWENVDYPELWQRFRVGWVSEVLYRNAGITGKFGTWVSTTPATTKDSRTRQICYAAKQQKITIFSIAFEAEPGGEELLRYCATTSGHYYKVYGAEIRSAFRSIASHITQLRLTQ